MLITLKYGTGNERKYDQPPGVSLQAVLDNPTNRASLGYGKNVEGWIGGVPQDGAFVLREQHAGMTITVNDKACEKA